jgi:hypothetical protein
MEQVITIRLNIAKPPFQLHAGMLADTRSSTSASRVGSSSACCHCRALHRCLVGRRWHPLLALVPRLTGLPNWNAGLASSRSGHRGVRLDQGLEHFGKPFGGTIRPEALNADAGAFTQ